MRLIVEFDEYDSECWEGLWNEYIENNSETCISSAVDRWINSWCSRYYLTGNIPNEYLYDHIYETLESLDSSVYRDILNEVLDAFMGHQDAQYLADSCSRTDHDINGLTDCIVELLDYSLPPVHDMIRVVESIKHNTTQQFGVARDVDFKCSIFRKHRSLVLWLSEQ